MPAGHAFSFIGNVPSDREQLKAVIWALTVDEDAQTSDGQETDRGNQEKGPAPQLPCHEHGNAGQCINAGHDQGGKAKDGRSAGQLADEAAGLFGDAAVCFSGHGNVPFLACAYLNRLTLQICRL